jgi:glycine betaine/proline transport system substrate-binding protein
MKKTAIGMMLAAGVLGSAALVGTQAQQNSPSKYCAAGNTVKFAGIGWESGQFITEVLRNILEKGYGCKTEVIIGSTTVTETALINGDLHVWAEEWEGFNDIVIKGVKDGKAKLVGKILQGGTVEGWFVPRYLVEGDSARGIKALAPDLKSVSDLAKYKDLFKDDENPNMSRLLGCVSGWVCDKTNDGKLRAYKLNSMYQQFRPGSQAALDASVASAFQQGKPILFYYWAPTSLLGKFDVIQLKEPKYNAKCYELEKANDPKACPSATPSATLRINLNADFANSDATLTRFFGKTSFSLAQLQKAILRVSEEKISPADAAVDFLKTQKATWSKWVPAGVAQKVEASMMK